MLVCYFIYIVSISFSKYHLASQLLRLEKTSTGIVDLSSTDPPHHFDGSRSSTIHVFKLYHLRHKHKLFWLTLVNVATALFTFIRFHNCSLNKIKITGIYQCSDDDKSMFADCLETLTVQFYGPLNWFEKYIFTMDQQNLNLLNVKFLNYLRSISIKAKANLQQPLSNL